MERVRQSLSTPRAKKTKSSRSAADYLPATLTLPSLRDAAQMCKGCDLYKNATQAVFGEGREDADIVFVGEVPGDREDLAGHPFVGPAGKLLDRALQEAGISRTEVYITNAVKHFKWIPRGKRRLHRRPSEVEIAACRPWLQSELALLKPKVLVCLGASAASTIFQRAVRVGDVRATFSETALSSKTYVTVHPSSILRVIDAADREREYARFVADLAKLKPFVKR